MRHREGLKTGDWAYWHRLLSYYWKLSSPYWKQDHLRLKIPLLRGCEQRSFAALYEQRQIGELPLTEYLPAVYIIYDYLHSWADRLILNLHNLLLHLIYI